MYVVNAKVVASTIVGETGLLNQSVTYSVRFYHLKVSQGHPLSLKLMGVVKTELSNMHQSELSYCSLYMVTNITAFFTFSDCRL